MIIREGDGLFAGGGESSCQQHGQPCSWLGAAPAAVDDSGLKHYLATCSFCSLCCWWICSFNTSAHCYYLPTSTSKSGGLILLLSLKTFVFAAPELVTSSRLAPTHLSGWSQCVEWADKPVSRLVVMYKSFHLFALHPLNPRAAEQHCLKALFLLCF